MAVNQALRDYVAAKKSGGDQFVNRPTVTWAFTNDDMEFISKNSLKRQYAEAATTCGFYFEACVYRSLCALLGQSTNASDLSPEQVRAEMAFAGGYTPKDRMVVAYQRARIEEAAAQAAKSWYDTVTEKLQRQVTDKDFKVEVIADVVITKNGIQLKRGNPVGDILIKALSKEVQAALEGDKIVLELKWQEDAGAVIHYFHSVSEETLFGGGYKAQLKSASSWIWQRTMQQADWQSALAGQLLAFLAQKVGAPQQQLKYLLNKGEMRNQKGRDYDLKYVVRGTSVSVTIMDIDSLASALAPTAARTTILGKSDPRGGIRYYNGDGDDVATFGIKSYAQGRGTNIWRKGLKGETREARAMRSIDNGNFTFQMYISSKLFNQESLI